MFDPNHLTLASKYSNLSKTRWFYFKHMIWALHLSFTLFSWSLLMILHAFIPQLVGFYVIEKMVKYISKLKESHPEDPILKNIQFVK
jgi:hypothetical protein